MITEKDVHYIASLSRIHLKENEAKDLTKDLENILDYVKKLENLDVSTVEPTAHVLPLTNVFREDQPHESLSQDAALKFAVEKKEGSFKVPKVIE